jgi:predicted GIY-YIG superfamily endonuclease
MQLKKKKKRKTKLENYNSVKSYNKPVQYRTKKQYFVYVIECENNAVYIGIAFDINKRFKQHLGGYAAGFTKDNKPIKIIETMPTHTVEQGLACVFENYKVCEYKRLHPNKIIGGGSRKMKKDKYR